MPVVGGRAPLFAIGGVSIPVCYSWAGDMHTWILECRLVLLAFNCVSGCLGLFLSLL